MYYYIATETTVETQLSCHMKTYQDHLKSLYKSLELISPLEMLDCFSTQYINLTMCKGEEDNYPNFMLQQNERCDSVTLVEALDVDGQERKVVLILGGPGMGKSTLAINICKQWAEGSLLQGYDAVVLLLLRDLEIQGAKTIKDLLQTLNDDLRENIFKEIVNNNGEKVCFIFEGYDELPYHLQKDSVFTKLIEKLPKCTLVYTSRPEAYYKIPYRGCKIIKINGFGKESVDMYISEAFEKHKNGEEMAQKLKTQVHNNPVVRSILHTPINVAIVCLIFFHYSTLPKTLTELYTKLCLRLILRYIVTRTPNEGQVEKLQSLDNLPTGISEQFLQLCHVAYQGMENEKIIFTSQDLAEFGIAEDKLHGMGLLLIAPTTSVAGREKSYNFVHLTLQEFCAAWYISKLSAEEQAQCMKDPTRYWEDIKMVWRFYSGITKLQNVEVIDMLPYKIIKSPFSHQESSELINDAYEASNSEVCQIVGDYYKDSVINLDQDELESHAINYVLTQYKGLLRVRKGDSEILIDWSLQHDVDINHLLDDMAVKYLNSVYELSISGKYIKLISQIVSNSITLKILCIHGSFELNEFKCLASCKNVLLQNLSISHCRLEPSNIDAIGKMLSHNKSIKFVDLSHNDITDKGIEMLVHHLMDNNTFQQINLYDNLITEDGVTHLSKLITREHSVLTSIELSNNPLRDEGVNLLLQSLPLGIEHIGLCDVQMTPLSCQSLGDALHKVKSISFDQLIDFELDNASCNGGVIVPNEYLEMFNNYMKSISTNYWEVITTNLVNTTVLEHLEVRVGDLRNSKLINAIGQNQSIKELKLLFYCISSCVEDESNWEAELVQCIQHSTSLEQLTISGNTDYALQLFKLLTDSLMTNTSIKSLVFDLETSDGYVELFGEDVCIDLYDVCNAIEKVKENKTLDELTLNKVIISLDDDYDTLCIKIENCVQQINRTRNIKGIANLKVNINCKFVF